MERLILVTGGAGYIGSHTSTELLAAGHPLVVLDNLSNSSPVSLDRVRALAPGPLTFIEGDMGDGELLDRLFAEHDIGAVVHFAGLKAVGESCRIPLRYYRNNITGTLGLLGAMDRAGCRNLIFSSSATVYGDPASLPITEDFPLSTTNPYGRTKLFIEEILRDVCAADPRWRAVLLRYFNPVGAHPSGRIGEDPRDIPNNLMPYIMQVAVGRRDALQVFGDDYDTPDGTGVRDYIHVTDLARGHVAALERLEALPGCTPINLGTGRGYSVLEVVRAAEKASGRFIPYTVVDRRPGDIAACWADPSLAEKLLGWRAELGIDRMCVDHWRWQSDNPEGFGSQGS